MKRTLILATALAATVAAVGTSFAQNSAKPDKLVVAAYGGIWAELGPQELRAVLRAEDRHQGRDHHRRVGRLAGEDPRQSRQSADPCRGAGGSRQPRAGKEGLLEQATVAKLPNLADIPDQFHKPWNDFSVTQNIGGLGVMYVKSAIPDPPKSWREFIDNVAAGKYGKRVSMPAGTYTWGPELLATSQQYGGDVDEAFKKLKEASKYVVKFWNTPVEALNLIGTKEVDALVYWDGRAISFIDKGNDWAGFYRRGRRRSPASPCSRR